MAQDGQRRLAEYERQVGELQGQLKTLEEEIVYLGDFHHVQSAD